tara:strand:- start:119 stop:337 length:219 start_codon:yes stop_codon:yes gene_type:complete
MLSSDSSTIMPSANMLGVSNPFGSTLTLIDVPWEIIVVSFVSVILSNAPSIDTEYILLPLPIISVGTDNVVN